MSLKAGLRVVHRWLGLALVLPILGWMGSGFYFALVPIETIRGEHLAAAPEPLTASLLQGLVSPEQAWQAMTTEFGPRAMPGGIRLLVQDGRALYRIEAELDGQVFVRCVDGQSGRIRPALDAAAAQSRARVALRQAGAKSRVHWVEQLEPGSEVRGRRTPLWQVAFTEPEAVRVYLDPWTAEVVALRTDRWRVFDFLWMLHILDFSARENFNTPWLAGAALTGLCIALSGFLYWALTRRRIRRN